MAYNGKTKASSKGETHHKTKSVYMRDEEIDEKETEEDPSYQPESEFSEVIKVHCFYLLIKSFL